MARYVMDHGAVEESRRLALLEAWADAGTIRCLEEVGVRPGWSCWEVGAGAGSIARWLSERVGPLGSVLATDVDCRHLDANGALNLGVRRHDVVSDALPERAFDLVHARMVLEHIPERANVLHKLVSALKPGGWLVVEDQDIASVAPACEPGSTASSRFMLRSLALARLLGAAGVDLEYGRRLYGALTSAQLTGVRAEGRVALVAGCSPLALFWRLTWEQLRPKLIGSGLLDEWDVDDFISLLDDPDFVWLAPTIVAAWGRRPNA